MSQFEYLAVLISIILGLGITQLLSGFGRWLEQRAKLRPYAPSLAWAAFLLLVHVQTWWAMYGLRDASTWSFLQFAVVLLQPIVLFLLTILTFPGPGSREDLRANYFVQRRWFFGLMMALLVVSVLKDVVREGNLPSVENLAFHVLFMVVALTGFVSAHERTHRWLSYAAIVTGTVYVALLFGALEVS